MEAATTSASGAGAPVYQRYRVMWPLVPPSSSQSGSHVADRAGQAAGPIGEAVGRAFQQDFADACQSAFAAGGAIMFIAFLVALAFMQPGRETATE